MLIGKSNSTGTKTKRIIFQRDIFTNICMHRQQWLWGNFISSKSKILFELRAPRSIFPVPCCERCTFETQITPKVKKLIRGNKSSKQHVVPMFVKRKRGKKKDYLHLFAYEKIHMVGAGTICRE